MLHLPWRQFLFSLDLSLFIMDINARHLMGRGQHELRAYFAHLSDTNSTYSTLYDVMNNENVHCTIVHTSLFWVLLDFIRTQIPVSVPN